MFRTHVLGRVVVVVTQVPLGTGFDQLGASPAMNLAGLDEWAFDACLPFLVRLETDRDIDAPYHLGAEAPTPVALMRSRYAGFALKKVDYLWRTLHPEHPDRAEPEAVGIASLRATCERLKYPGLRIVDTREAGPRGLPEVLFYARMFERGVDRARLLRAAAGPAGPAAPRSPAAESTSAAAAPPAPSTTPADRRCRPPAAAASPRP